MSHIERAVSLLFPENGPRTLNIKFLCGGVDHNITAEALAEQLVRAEVQIRSPSAQRVDNIDRHLTPAR